MNKPLTLLLTLLLTFTLLNTSPTSHAQTQPEPPFDLVSVELWPDYDQEALLVLLSLVLPEGTTLPVSISLPIDPDAEIHAVAYVDPESGHLLNLPYEQLGANLTFTTPSLGVRVEYYQPYEVTGTARTIEFVWISNTAVNQLVTSIQEPLAATNFSITPTPDQIQQMDTGIRYHLYNPRPLTAGQPAAYTINYDLPSGSLTSTLQPTPSPLSNESAPTMEQNILPDWALFAVAFAFAAVAFFFFGSAWRERSQKKPTKSEPTPTPVVGQVCGVCGTAVVSTAKFCPQCGSPTNP
jgi:hypothetical protein